MEILDNVLDLVIARTPPLVKCPLELDGSRLNAESRFLAFIDKIVS